MSTHQIPKVSTLWLVFLALFVGTIITVAIAYFDIGLLNTPVALAIAVTKATLVVWYFMGVRWNTPLTKVVVVAGFFWLFILFGLTLNDYLTRDWLGVVGR